jgi:hypothetical protein
MVITNYMFCRNPFINHTTFEENLDGDGQINFDNVFFIISELNKDEEAIFSCRANRYGISKERKIVELFETFILSEMFEINLPDSQCGCWGFKSSLIAQKQISVSSKGFELELDLLSSLLMSRTLPTFHYVEVSSSAKTDFEKGDHNKKMIFLCNKLKIDKFRLESFMEKFEKLKKIELLESYKKSILEHIPEDYAKKRVKCYGCDERATNPNCPYPQ